MLSDIIAPGRLRDGDPQALAALVAVGGWAVVVLLRARGRGRRRSRAPSSSPSSRSGGARSRPATSAAADLERILLESARDAVDEVRGERARRRRDARCGGGLRTRQPAAALAAAGDAGAARARRRPRRSRAIPPQVRAAAERSYAAAYERGRAGAGGRRRGGLGPASPLLLRAAQRQRRDARRARAARAAPASRPRVRPGARRRPRPGATRRRRHRRVGERRAARRCSPTRCGRCHRPSARARSPARSCSSCCVAVRRRRRGPRTPPRPRRGAPSPSPRTTTVPPARRAPARSQVVRGRPRRAAGRQRRALRGRADRERVLGAGDPRRASRAAARAGSRSRCARATSAVATSCCARSATGCARGRGVVARPARRSRSPRAAAGARRDGCRVGARAQRAPRLRGARRGAAACSIAFEPGGLDEPTVLVPLGDSYRSRVVASYRGRRRHEHAQARGERDRAPAGVDRPALLARRLGRIEAAADDEHVEAPAPQRGLEAALVAPGRQEAVDEAADELDVVVDPRPERRPDRGQAARPSSPPPARRACRSAPRAASRRRRDRCCGSARR